MTLYRTLQGSLMAPDPGLPWNSPHANGIKCPQHYTETLRKHGRKKPVAEWTHPWSPAPLWTSLAWTHHLIHTLDVLRSGSSCPGHRADLSSGQEGRVTGACLDMSFAAQDAVFTHFLPKGSSLTPTCQQQCQLPQPGALIW